MAANILLREGADTSLATSSAVSERRVATVLLLVDILLLTAAVIGFLASREQAWSSAQALAHLCGLAALPFFKAMFGLYPGHGLSRAQRLRQVVLAIGCALLVNAGIIWLFMAVQLIPGPAERAGAWPLILLGALLVTGSDPIVRRVLMRMDRWRQPVFIFGGGEAAAEIVRQLALYPHLGFRAVCIVDDASIYIPDEQLGIPVVRFKELSAHASALAMATTALVVEPTVERSFVLRIHTEGLFRRIILVNQLHDVMSLKSAMRRVGGMLAVELGPARPNRIALAAKRAFDLVGSAAGLILLSPILGLLAFLVRNDSPGPVLFSQPRWAGDDRRFMAHKFRTMYVDGDRRLRQHFMTNPAAEREYARYRKLDKDPRVTRIGRLLRSSSLDELPQLVNVWRGEMSIVGPRPYTIDELHKLGPAAADILSLVKPGITGFWQVSGRNRRTFRERIEMDCYYVRNFSLWLDIWVIYRTVIAVVTREGK